MKPTHHSYSEGLTPPRSGEFGESRRSFSVDAARSARQPVLAFDLGGTWFRTALVGPEGEDVRLLDKSPARNSRNYGGSASYAQKKMIDYIADRAKTYCPESGISNAAVSIGAAVNMNTGRIVASAPLWGSFTCDLDLRRILTAEVPDLCWSVLNDVTALAIRLATVPIPHTPSHAAALTVSSAVS